MQMQLALELDSFEYELCNPIDIIWIIFIFVIIII